jgi:hypothetical protein
MEENKKAIEFAIQTAKTINESFAPEDRVTIFKTLHNEIGMFMENETMAAEKHLAEMRDFLSNLKN